MWRHSHSRFSRDESRPSAQVGLNSISALPSPERNNLSTLLGRDGENLSPKGLRDIEFDDFGGNKFFIHNCTPGGGDESSDKGLTQITTRVL
jgi:hypothetical protein